MHPKHMYSGLRGEGGTGEGYGSIGRNPTGSASFGGGGGPGVGAPGFVPNEQGQIASLRTRRGTPPPSSRTPRPVDRPGCAFTQCQEQIITAGFAWIEADVPALEVNQAGQSLWYGLRSVDVRATLSQEVRVLGLHYRILPCDVAGEGWPGMTTPLAWGDATGISAAIVIGVNLPVDLGAWNVAPCYAVGLNAAATMPTWQRNTGTTSTPGGSDAPQLLFGPLRFPTGQLSDVSPNVAEADISLQGDCAPVIYGERLDVALVVSPNYLAGQGAGQIAGFAQIDLVIGHTIAGKSWSV